MYQNIAKTVLSGAPAGLGQCQPFLGAQSVNRTSQAGTGCTNIHKDIHTDKNKAFCPMFNHCHYIIAEL